MPTFSVASHRGVGGGWPHAHDPEGHGVVGTRGVGDLAVALLLPDAHLVVLRHQPVRDRLQS